MMAKKWIPDPLVKRLEPRNQQCEGHKLKPHDDM